MHDSRVLSQSQFVTDFVEQLEPGVFFWLMRHIRCWIEGY